MNSHLPKSTPHNNKLAMVMISIALLACILIASLAIAYSIVTEEPSKVTIINANLSRFELTSSSKPCLSYNLTITMSIHNSDWLERTVYQDMEVDFYYNMEKFDSVKLEEFSIKPRRTLPFSISRSGNSTISVIVGGTGGIDAPFRRSNETRFFELNIWLKKIINGECHWSYQCKLNLQLITSQNNSTQGSFHPVKCY